MRIAASRLADVLVSALAQDNCCKVLASEACFVVCREVQGKSQLNGCQSHHLQL